MREMFIDRHGRVVERVPREAFNCKGCVYQSKHTGMSCRDPRGGRPLKDHHGALEHCYLTIFVLVKPSKA